MIQYITLREILIKSFDARLLISVYEHMCQISGIQELNPNAPDPIITDYKKQEYIHWCDLAKMQCELHGLTLSAKRAKRMSEYLSRPKALITYGEMKPACDEFINLLYDEMESKVLVQIEPRRAYLVLETDLFGKAVSNAFPSAEQDIKHAGRCLALEEWTASVFHSMRILEIGLILLAKEVGVTKTDRQNWERLIDDIESRIEPASSGDRNKEQFYSESALQFRYFKNAWRNHVMHVRDTYDEERAEIIFRHIKEFMSHLATKLEEPTP